MEIVNGSPGWIELVQAQSPVFRSAESSSNPDCGLPVTEPADIHPTRQPVVLDFWRRDGQPAGRSFGTVGSWEQWLDIIVAGDVYTSCKHGECGELPA